MLNFVKISRNRMTTVVLIALNTEQALLSCGRTGSCCRIKMLLSATLRKLSDKDICTFTSAKDLDKLHLIQVALKFQPWGKGVCRVEEKKPLNC